jgi:hypothetical protein
MDAASRSASDYCNSFTGLLNLHAETIRDPTFPRNDEVKSMLEKPYLPRFIARIFGDH